MRASALTKLYGETIALWNVDLEARPGELVGVHGTNASGKTTLLRLLARLTSPSGGEVAFDPAGSAPRLALAGHATHLVGDLTALENLRLAQQLARTTALPPVALLDVLGVAAVAPRRVRTLSAGTRRRLALARAVITAPDVLLVDEPFAGLDSTAAERVVDLLRDTRDRGAVVVVATHDDERTRTLEARAVWLADGHSVAAPAITLAKAR